MSMRFATALILASMALSAHAQTVPDRLGAGGSDVLTGKDTEVLPVWNNHSGKVEALLLLQPAQQANGS
ncbi:MAG TPA: hypothetical protein VK753_08440, partial [Xanthomonadaceae bacterium]|nr:hypothetical protein [Xanthomonadaceae bacterium]